jgi:hypothetical protein
MIRRKLILASITFLANLLANAQTSMENNTPIERSYLPASPTATMFNIFGQIPVSHYTGTPDINIALGKIGFKDINLNLELKYHSSVGTRPDAVPGYYGNGWLLTIGGMITRLSKGLRTFELTSPSPMPNEDVRSYPDWSSSNRLQQYLSNATQFYDDGGKHDEFSFQFLNFSGKFYTDIDGKKKVKTSAGEDLLVEVQTMPNKVFNLPTESQSGPRRYSTMTVYSPTNAQKQFIYKFIITDSRGIKYIFGGNDAAIDFVRPGLLYGAFDQSASMTLPSNWHLTSIQSPNGYKIEFEYERGPFYVTSEANVTCRQLIHSKISSPLTIETSNRKIKSSLYNPCYLKKITSPASSVQFYWSKADAQLKYFHIAYNPVSPAYDISQDIDLNNPAYFCKYPDVVNADMDNRFSQKLDSFVIFDKADQKRQRVILNYSSNTNARLKLLSVQINGPGEPAGKALIYSFTYNQLSLPGYRSFNTDKFGFYNGPHNYINSDDPNYYLSLFNNPVNRTPYLQSRKPDPAYTKAEILEKVTYPTGGYTMYDYENNKYGRLAKSWLQSIEENTGNNILLAGGLRIKSIRNYDGVGNMTGKKTYYYSKNYPDTSVSSGVLSYMPRFYKRFEGYTTAPANLPSYDGNIIWTHFSTNPINPQGYNKGGAITYSEVAEVEANGGYKILVYKNHDNGYADRPGENMLSDNTNVADFWEEDDVNSLDQERGQLLAEKVYDNTSFLVKKTINKYNESSNRFDDHLRMLKTYPNDCFHQNFPSIRYIAFLQYTYFPYLSSKEEYLYTKNGDSILTVSNYIYDTGYKVVKQVTVVGNNNTNATEYFSYPFDHVRAGDTVPYAEMVRRNMLHMVTDKETWNNGNFLLKESSTYAKNLSVNQALILLHKKIKVFAGQDTVIQSVFNLYDTIGNPVWLSNAQNMSSSLVWGYGGLFPVAEIINADYPTVRTALGGSTAVSVFAAKPTPSNNEVAAFIAPLRNSSSLNTAMVSTFVSDPMIGIVLKEDENRIRTYYEYDYLMRLSLERDNDSNIVKKYGYKLHSQPDPVTGFYSDSMTRVFRKIDCNTMHIGKPVSITLPEGFRFSYQSKADANAKALQYLLSYGPTYADTSASGGCSLHSGPVYILAKYENQVIDQQGNTYADIFLEFYADPSFTIPIGLPDTAVAFSLTSQCQGGGVFNPIYDTVLVNGKRKFLVHGHITLAIPGIMFCEWVWENGLWVEHCMLSPTTYCPLSWSFSFSASGPGGGDPEPPDPEPGVFKLGNVYAKATVENILTDISGTSYGDIRLTFYSDVACTIPTSVSNLNIDYVFTDDCGGPSPMGGNITANGGSYVLSAKMVGYVTPSNQQCAIAIALLSW